MKQSITILLIVFVHSSCKVQVLDRRDKITCDDGTTAASAEECEASTAEESKVAIKLQSDDCVDPDLSLVSKATKLMLCDGTMAEGKLDLSGISAENIKTGVKIGSITGTLTPSNLSDCSSDGEIDCKANASFKAADVSKLVAGNIKNGVQIGGVSGNYEGGSYPDASYVKLGVQYGPTGTDYTGTKRDIKLCKNGKGITDAGGNTTTPWDDGETNGDDSIDDYQDGASPWYTGAERSNCNEDNFTDVTGGTNLVPDDAKRIAAGGGLAWTKIFQDDLTGLYFTNVLADDDGSTDKTWSEALDLCAGLDGGTAGSGWRLPTQKELMQLHIDGISKLTTFGNTVQYFWSSSSVSNFTTYAWFVNLRGGSTNSIAKPNTRAVACVSECGGAAVYLA